jgi:hypothetical protein
MNKTDYRKLLPHLFAVGVFLLILAIYFSPVLEGKAMYQDKTNDVYRAGSMQKEIQDYYLETGEFSLWTNAVFSGMPTYQIWAVNPGNHIGYFKNLFKLYLPEPMGVVFSFFLMFYILLLVLRISPLLAFIGGVAFAFSSYNFINIDAGHLGKIYAIAYMPLVISGVILTLRQKYLIGGIISAVGLSLEIKANHFQITYYLFMILFILLLFELVRAIQEKRLLGFTKSIGVLFLAAVLALGSNASTLWTNYEYAKATMRGGSELSTQKHEGSGLNKDYAFSWSYGKMETFTLLIPAFMGGASTEALSTSSNTYKALVDKGVPRKQALNSISNIPSYWGTMKFTSGPVYFGAIMIFLFVLGCFVVKNKYKWWLIIITTLSILLAWGENLMWFNSLFFDYVPFYNKFRVPMTLLVIASLSVPLMAVFTLHTILKKNSDTPVLIKALKNSLYIVAGLLLFFVLFGSMLFDFRADSDESIFGKDQKWLLEAIMADRARMLRLDALRSFFFILLTFGALWLFLKNKIQMKYMLPAMALFVIIDMSLVDYRYLNKEDFSRRKWKSITKIDPTDADKTIMADTDPNFRVLNLTPFNQNSSPFIEARTSYFHKSVGGYHGAKLRRYQDLIDSCIFQELSHVFRGINNRNIAAFYQTPVLNMLNTKYYIADNSSHGVLPNPGRMGNAWFVEEFHLLANPDEEIQALKNFDPEKTAFIEQRFKEELTDFQPYKDSLSLIRLLEYKPNYLRYEYENTGEALLVFSEIYYMPGWIATIDGKEVPHFRANYVLRAMRVPAGKHVIEFEFRPASFYSGEKICRISSWIIILSLLGFLAHYIYVMRTQK